MKAQQGYAFSYKRGETGGAAHSCRIVTRNPMDGTGKAAWIGHNGFPPNNVDCKYLSLWSQFDPGSADLTAEDEANIEGQGYNVYVPCTTSYYGCKQQGGYNDKEYCVESNADDRYEKMRDPSGPIEYAYNPTLCVYADDVFLTATEKTQDQCVATTTTTTTSTTTTVPVDARCDGVGNEVVRFNNTADVKWICDQRTQNGARHSSFLHYTVDGPKDDNTGEPFPADLQTKAELPVIHTLVVCKDSDMDIEACTVNTLCNACQRAEALCPDPLKRETITVNCESR
ncbi:unnamed protein product [Amoebophrya sp. A120]|nr:unnamed protein product [Amoebophrya sp. A120]|eukprot:GSA120T00011771001.1